MKRVPIILAMMVALAMLAGCAERSLYPVPPTGWVLFCQNNPSDPGCDDYEHLERLNAYVNGFITYEPEPIGEEVWRVVEPGGTGDCEDYALTKRVELVKAGWSLDRLHLATCVTETGYAHVVLIVEIGQRWVVLDNRYHEPMPFEAMPYRWLAVQFGDKWLNYQFMPPRRIR